MQEKIVQEFQTHMRTFEGLKGGTSYIPVYKDATRMINEIVPTGERSTSCPTCIGASESGNIVVIGYSDDSMILHDVRSGYKDKIRLEVGSHTDTVKSIVFSEHDGDFLCLTGGSDNKMKLWDLRQRKCIRDYGGNYD
jgi:WD40 repeat protein